MNEVISVINLFTALIQGFLTLCCGCPGFLIALGAVIFAARAAHETRQNTQAQIASALLDTYAEEGMLDNIGVLKEWYENHPDAAVAAFMADRITPATDAFEVDRARRHLSHFFQKAAILLHHNLIDKCLLKTVISKSQLDLYEKLAQPLEDAIAEQVTKVPNPRWTVDKLHKLHDLPCKD